MTSKPDVMASTLSKDLMVDLVLLACMLSSLAKAASRLCVFTAIPAYFNVELQSMFPSYKYEEDITNILPAQSPLLSSKQT
jgi:hypothetical protein